MEKKITYGMLLFSSFCFSQVGVNTEKPDLSSNLTVSALDQDNRYKGTLLSPMTTAQINTIQQPAKGLLAYDTERKCLKVNIGTSDDPDWKCLKTKTF